MSDTSGTPVKPARDTRTAFAKMPAVALADHRLTDAAFRLYAVFIDTVNPDDTDPTVWLSRAHMAKRCGKSPSSVKSMDKALDNLVACGYIKLIGERHGQTSHYALVPVTELDRTYGQSTTPPVVNQPHLPVVNRPHNQEPVTKNPDQEPIKYNPGKPARAENHTQPPLMQFIQGKDKYASEEGGDSVSVSPDLRPRLEDKTNDRLVCHVAYAIDVGTRVEAVDYLTDEDGVVDYGTTDTSDWVWAVRAMIVGGDGCPRMVDRDIRDVVDAAKAAGDLQGLVEFIQDGTWPGGGSIASVGRTGLVGA